MKDDFADLAVLDAYKWWIGSDFGFLQLTGVLDQDGNGQPGLLRNTAMDRVALDWAEKMAASGVLSHNPNYASQVPSGWSRVGENVALGHRTATAMHDGWMSSAGHRANILGDFTDIGVASIQFSTSCGRYSALSVGL